MIAGGQMDDSMIEKSRQTMEETVASIGGETLTSMGIAYAVSCDEAAGMDIEHMQMSYLWSEGLKMFLMAVVMLIAAVAIAFIAARVGAGIGRSLRSRVFGNVMRFSNAEIDRFSTASLITRNTNDIQQIQMVTAIMLRMVLYAPILGNRRNL